MTYTSRQNLWNINKAAVFVDAINAVAASQNRHDHGEHRYRSHVKAARSTTTPSSLSSLTPRFAAVTIGLAIIAGLAVANWIA